MTNILSTVQITGAADLINACMSGGFLADFVTVMAANIALSGDNALVIALAARALPQKRRLRGIILGTIAAILMRIALGWSAATPLDIPCVALCGGLVTLFIALKLLLDRNPDDEEKNASGRILRMIGLILIADLVMSLDNIPGVAGASRGNPALLALGLGVSIPIVAFGSGIASRLMGRFPVAVYAGSAVLGKIAAEMVLTDPAVVKLIHTPAPTMRYGAEALVALGLVAVGVVLIRLRDMRHRPITVHEQGPFHVAGWDIR